VRYLEAVLDPSPNRLVRLKNSDECKQRARSARSRQGVSYAAVAAAMRVHTQFAARCFGEEGSGCQFSYADLFLLAREPQTARMVRDMLAPLLELVDPRNLRLGDLEGMAATSTTAHTALQYLRPTFERLAPLMDVTSTAEVER